MLDMQNRIYPTNTKIVYDISDYVEFTSFIFGGKC